MTTDPNYHPFAQPPAAPAAAQTAGEAADAPAVSPAPAPAPGEVCRYATADPYHRTDPEGERDQIVLVTGQPDETGAVKGVVLGWAEQVEASFRPEQLRPA